LRRRFEASSIRRRVTFARYRSEQARRPAYRECHRLGTAALRRRRHSTEALWAEATAQIQKYGAMIKSPTGFPFQSPYLAIANRHQAEIMMRIASEFGFTPASRSCKQFGAVTSRPVLGGLHHHYCRI
jgi:hypothetical protein